MTHLYPLDPALVLKTLLDDRETGPIPTGSNALRFVPDPADPFRLPRYGRVLETPLGAAAGPHTQLCQNIVNAWQAGARYLELKTVQVRDDISISRPCIDMRSESYNCEWSQELRLAQSYREYLHAYVLIHILRHAWGHPANSANSTDEGPGFLFNMSAGYDLAGIKSRPMQEFFDAMANAREDIDQLRAKLAPIYPAVRDIPINSCLSDNITLSTMHGCPPEEIERICRYFLEDRGLHTSLKFNPTLLGPEELRGVLADLGYQMDVPDDAFTRDLQYKEALDLIRSLSDTGKQAGREFHAKLTNTLPVRNKNTALPTSEPLVYLSGRALHPLALLLGAKLQASFDGVLDLSFSAGLSSEHVADTLACGLWPLTVCSDLLKPGGYARLHAMLRELRDVMRNTGAASPQALVQTIAGEKDISKAKLRNITLYAQRCAAPHSPFAQKAGQVPRAFSRPLPVFDCAAAPCSGVCPADQHQPAYLGHYALGEGKAARLDLILGNPLHHMQAVFCDQLCRHKCEKYCSRGHVDSPVRIQAVRALVQAEAPPLAPMLTDGRAVLIRGDGIAGLVCAFWLNRAGMPVLVEQSGITRQKQREAAMGKALMTGLAEDIKALSHRGVKFSAQAVALPSLLPSDLTIYTSADALEDALMTPPEAEGDISAVTIRRAQGLANGYRSPQPPSSINPVGPLILTGNAATSNAASLGEAIREGTAMARLILQAYGLPLSEKTPRDRANSWHSHKNTQVTRRSLSIFTATQARNEAGRCLQCDLGCGVCVSVCPNRANFFAISPPQAIAIPCLRQEKRKVRVSYEGEFRCEEPVQVLHLADICNQCGNCACFCPSSEAPFRVKPRLFLSDHAFAEHDNGVLLTKNTMVFKRDRGLSSLTLQDSRLIFEDERAQLVIESSSMCVEEATLKAGHTELVMDNAAVAMLLYLLTQEIRALLD